MNNDIDNQEDVNIKDRDKDKSNIANDKEVDDNYVADNMDRGDDDVDYNEVCKQGSLVILVLFKFVNETRYI